MAYVMNVYQGDHIAATDLQNIENNFEYLRTNFKGAGAPPDPGGGLEGATWWDSTNKTLKLRSDSEWRGVFTGAASFKIWAYLDAVPDGWTRDATVTDLVLSLKGGAVYTTGADKTQGSWTISGLTDSGHGHNHSHSHNHKWYDFVNTTNEDTTYDTNGGVIDLETGGTKSGADRTCLQVYNLSGDIALADAWTDNDATTDNTSGAATIVSDAAWRIAAATGILLYPKL